MAVYLAPVYFPQSQPQELKHPEDYPDLVGRYSLQLQYMGFRRAILSSTREMVDIDPLAEYEAVGETGIPILLIWGEDDHLIPEERIENVRSALGLESVAVIEDAGHSPIFDQPDEVMEILLGFLGE